MGSFAEMSDFERGAVLASALAFGRQPQGFLARLPHGSRLLAVAGQLAQLDRDEHLVQLRQMSRALIAELPGGFEKIDPSWIDAALGNDEAARRIVKGESAASSPVKRFVRRRSLGKLAAMSSSGHLPGPWAKASSVPGEILAEALIILGRKVLVRAFVGHKQLADAFATVLGRDHGNGFLADLPGAQGFAQGVARAILQRALADARSCSDAREVLFRTGARAIADGMDAHSSSILAQRMLRHWGAIFAAEMTACDSGAGFDASALSEALDEALGQRPELVQTDVAAE